MIFRIWEYYIAFVKCVLFVTQQSQINNVQEIIM